MNLVTESVTEKDFIKAVSKYKDIDTALENLSDEYVEFFMLNINNKKFMNKLKKNIKLNEYAIDTDNKTTTKWSPDEPKVRKIRYKGEFITLQYDSELGWLPTVRFRSVVNALRYIKKIADDYM